MRVKTLIAVVHKEDDLYVAECPEVGTASQGSSLDEAVANLREATELYLDEVSSVSSNPVVITTFEACVRRLSLWAIFWPIHSPCRLLPTATKLQSATCAAVNVSHQPPFLCRNRYIGCLRSLFGAISPR